MSMWRRSGVYRTFLIIVLKFCEARREILISTFNPVVNSKTQYLNSLDNAAQVRLSLQDTEHLRIIKNNANANFNTTMNFIQLTDRFNQI